MRIFLDASVFLAVALDQPERPELVKVTKQANLVAAAALPYEVGNALSAMVRRDRLTADEAVQALSAIRRVPVELMAVDIERALELASRHGIYAYDAYVLQCATAIRCPLLTLDKAMRRVAADLGIPLAEQP